MTRIRIAHGAFVLALVGCVALVGCSKKSQTTVESTPPPAETPAESPPPTTPAETPPTTPESPSVSWQDAYFDYDSYDLRDDARSALDGDAKMAGDVRISVKVGADGIPTSSEVVQNLGNVSHPVAACAAQRAKKLVFAHPQGDAAATLTFRIRMVLEAK